MRPSDSTTVPRSVRALSASARVGYAVEVPVERRVPGQNTELLARGDEAAQRAPRALGDRHAGALGLRGGRRGREDRHDQERNDRARRATVRRHVGLMSSGPSLAASVGASVIVC